MITVTDIIYRGNGYTATFSDKSVANAICKVVDGTLAIIGLNSAQIAAINVFNSTVGIDDPRFGIFGGQITAGTITETHLDNDITEKLNHLGAALNNPGITSPISTGLGVWLDTSQAVLTDGGGVTQLTDLSGNNHHAVSSGGYFPGQPQVAAFDNGLPGIRFTRNDSTGLSSGTIPVSGEPFTVMMAVKLENTGETALPAFFSLDVLGDTSTYFFGGIYDPKGGGGNAVFGLQKAGSDLIFQTAAGVADATNILVAISDDASNRRVATNGLAFLSNTPSAKAVSTLDGYTLGAWKRANPNAYSNFVLGEFCLWTRVLTVNEIQAERERLDAKWGGGFVGFETPITKGQLLRATGLHLGENKLMVTLADATTADNAVVYGVATEDIPNGATGVVLTEGTYVDDTSAFAVNDKAYLSDTPGDISPTPGTNEVVTGRVLSSGTAGLLTIVAGNDIVATIEQAEYFPFTHDASQGVGGGQFIAHSFGVSLFKDAAGVLTAPVTKLRMYARPETNTLDLSSAKVTVYIDGSPLAGASITWAPGDASVLSVALTGLAIAAGSSFAIFVEVLAGGGIGTFAFARGGVSFIQ